MGRDETIPEIRARLRTLVAIRLTRDLTMEELAEYGRLCRREEEALGLTTEVARGPSRLDLTDESQHSGH